MKPAPPVTNATILLLVPLFSSVIAFSLVESERDPARPVRLLQTLCYRSFLAPFLDRLRRQRKRRAGTPATMAKGGTSLVTTAPAPTMLPFPIVTPGNITAFTPMSAQASILTLFILRSV